MALEEQRVLRIPLTVGLLRKIDALIASGRGGFTDRAEFISEAAEAMVLELSYDEAPAFVDSSPRPIRLWQEQQELPPDKPSSSYGDHRMAGSARTDGSGERIRLEWGADANNQPGQLSLEFTRLAAPSRGATVARPTGTLKREPMFGLHNRDYPSLWAANRLALLTKDDLIEWDSALRPALIGEAWAFGRRLTEVDQASSRKLAALFPTNEEKKPSAEDGFMNFAFGTISTKGADLVSGGPLFQWGVVGVEMRERRPFVGLTEPGTELLRQLGDISLELPHSEDHARIFLNHLRRTSPPDFWGFEQVLNAVRGEITREELIKRYGKALAKEFPREPGQKPWSEVQIATDAAGYVARSREWGLLEPKQVRGRYVLTEFGRSWNSSGT